MRPLSVFCVQFIKNYIFIAEVSVSVKSHSRQQRVTADVGNSQFLLETNAINIQYILTNIVNLVHICSLRFNNK